MPLPLAALIPAAFGLVGQGLASGFNYASQMRTNQANIDLANKQYARQKADIAAMNAYNSPSSQVVRLRSAGLSPALYYGNGGATIAGQQSNVAQYDRANLVAPSFDARSIATTMSDLAKLPADIAETNMRTRYIEKQTAKLAVDLDFAIKNNPTLLERAKVDLEQAKANVDLTREQYNTAVANTKLANINIDKIAQEMQVNVVELMMAITKFPHELYNMDMDTLLKWSQHNKNNAEVLIGWATLSEMTRHNKQSETISENIRLDTYTFKGRENERTKERLELENDLRRLKERQQDMVEEYGLLGLLFNSFGNAIPSVSFNN